MPVLMNPLEKFLMITMNMGPASVLDIFGGFSFYAVSAGVKLNIFEVLHRSPATAAELSETINASERGTTILLDVLESLGYVKKKSSTYYNSRMVEKWMTADSATNLSLGFEYYYPLMHELFPYLQESVLMDKPHIEFYQWLGNNPEISRLYQQFMMTLAGLMTPELTKKLRLDRNCRRVIDIGGGHALYSIALCRKYPDLEVAIFDSSYVRPLALENIEKAQVNGRIKFIEGDYMSDDIDPGYDAALLFNVVHEHTGEENQQLMNRISSSLAVGGRIIVMDNLREKKMSRAADFITNIFSLLYFHSLGGQNYSFAEISGWLKDAGCKDIKRTNLGQTGLTLVTGYF